MGLLALRLTMVCALVDATLSSCPVCMGTMMCPSCHHSTANISENKPIVKQEAVVTGTLKSGAGVITGDCGGPKSGCKKCVRITNVSSSLILSCLECYDAATEGYDCSVPGLGSGPEKVKSCVGLSQGLVKPPGSDVGMCLFGHLELSREESTQGKSELGQDENNGRRSRNDLNKDENKRLIASEVSDFACRTTQLVLHRAVPLSHGRFGEKPGGKGIGLVPMPLSVVGKTQCSKQTVLHRDKVWAGTIWEREYLVDVACHMEKSMNCSADEDNWESLSGITAMSLAQTYVGLRQSGSKATTLPLTCKRSSSVRVELTACYRFDGVKRKVVKGHSRKDDCPSGTGASSTCFEAVHENCLDYAPDLSLATAQCQTWLSQY